jgi:hypothetical protein
MRVARRQVLLSGFGLGLAAAAGPRLAAAADAGEQQQSVSTYGIVPGDGVDQTASLQQAADAAARSGLPFSLPPGSYATSKLELKSGTQIQGVPGRSVLRYTGGGRLISIGDAADIRLTGLTLAGEATAIDGGALLVAEQVKGLDEASSIEPGFPYYLYNAQMTRVLAYGGMRDTIIAKHAINNVGHDSKEFYTKRDGFTGAASPYANLNLFQRTATDITN